MEKGSTAGYLNIQRWEDQQFLEVISPVQALLNISRSLPPCMQARYTPTSPIKLVSVSQFVALSWESVYLHAAAEIASAGRSGLRVSGLGVAPSVRGLSVLRTL
jgi:hypothetical protein